MATRPPRPAIAVNAVLVVVGLVAIAWGLTTGLHPEVSCHGVPMHAGDVCRRLEIDGSDKGKQQTYDAAVAQKRQAVPVIVGLGILVAAFPAALLVADLRSRRGEGGVRRDVAP